MVRVSFSRPQTAHPARFQAAVLYDFRLHDRDRALELYHAVVTQETGNTSNVHFAVRRIQQLTSELEPTTIDLQTGGTLASPVSAVDRKVDGP